jgi:hypothetical protein
MVRENERSRDMGQKLDEERIRARSDRLVRENERTREMRDTGQKLDEFDLGEKMAHISDSMKGEVRRLLERMDMKGNATIEELKGMVKGGLVTMMNTLEEMMNQIADNVAQDRKESEREMRRIDGITNRLEEKVREKEGDTEKLRIVEERLDKVEEEIGCTGAEIEKVRLMEDAVKRIEAKVKHLEEETARYSKEREKRSVKDMEAKLSVASKQIKIVDISFGQHLKERKIIVERTLEFMREDVRLSERKRLDKLLSKTKVIVLGKETTLRTMGKKSIHTVPILLECRTIQEKEELEEILKGANYFGTFHWPLEILDFVKGIKGEVKKMGYSEERQYIRVWPESREGNTQLRVDVKERKGGRFRTVGAWGVPPMDKTCWERDIFRPKWCKQL